MKEVAPSPEHAVDQLVERWKRGPVILASSSEFRREQLENAGFADVTLADPIPEEVEAVAATLASEQGLQPTHYDSDGRNFGELMASAKVQHVLKNQTIADEALVAAFDTVPVIYDEPTNEQVMGVPLSAEKFDTMEAARAGIYEQLTRLAAGARELSAVVEEIKTFGEEQGWTEEDIETTVLGRVIGFRRGKVYVSTGVAVAAPEHHDIIGTWTDEVQLVSDAIIEAKDDAQAIEKLVELILETQGDNTLLISGGIDYADSYVRDILKLREITFSEAPADERIYHGFASSALEIALRQQARVLSIKTAA